MRRIKFTRMNTKNISPTVSFVRSFFRMFSKFLAGFILFSFLFILLLGGINAYFKAKADTYEELVAYTQKKEAFLNIIETYTPFELSLVPTEVDLQAKADFLVASSNVTSKNGETVHFVIDDVEKIGDRRWKYFVHYQNKNGEVVRGYMIIDLYLNGVVEADFTQ